MIIRSVDACWLSVPIPTDRQHVSDFGRISTFDMALVRIDVASGLVGWGEAKAAVGSAGSCAAVVSLITDELAPQLVGQDARRVTQLWEEMYNGTRGHYALSRGRTFPALGRRGLNVAANPAGSARPASRAWVILPASPPALWASSEKTSAASA